LSALLWFVAFGAGAQSSHEAADCGPRPAGFAAQCGYIRLPQDYAAPAAGSVEIFYTRIQSRSAQPAADPLVYLVGGPGSSGSQLLQTSFRAYLGAFAPERDIIVIDQRGTGLSNPPLYCREALFRLDEILQSHFGEHAELLLDILSDCQARLARKNISFATFHSGNNARDIVQVLLALGYERWNLVGVSYGSRLALVMMRDYPQYLRSVILDSVYPPQADIYLDSYYSGERALAALFEACAAAPACAARYPDLADVFYALYERLNRQPLLASYSPPGYKTLNIEISGYRLYDWVFNWLYEVDSIAHIPRLIYELAGGQATEAARVGATYEASLTSLSLGMHYTVQCQEEYGAPPPDRDYIALLQAHPHLSGYLLYPVEGLRTLPRLCPLWPAEALPPALADRPVSSAVPPLLLSGHFDPITPPAYADMAATTLTTAYNYVLPHVGHGVLRSEDCAVNIALEFIGAPSSEPDSGCIAATQPIAFR